MTLTHIITGNGEFIVLSNFQCGFSPEIDGGIWHGDVSFARGSVGAEQYHNCIQEGLNAWRAQTNCDVDSNY